MDVETRIGAVVVLRSILRLKRVCLGRGMAGLLPRRVLGVGIEAYVDVDPCWRVPTIACS